MSCEVSLLRGDGECWCWHDSRSGWNKGRRISHVLLLIVLQELTFDFMNSAWPTGPVSFSSSNSLSPFALPPLRCLLPNHQCSQPLMPSSMGYKRTFANCWLSYLIHLHYISRIHWSKLTESLVTTTPNSMTHLFTFGHYVHLPAPPYFWC